MLDSCISYFRLHKIFTGSVHNVMDLMQGLTHTLFTTSDGRMSLLQKHSILGIIMQIVITTLYRSLCMLINIVIAEKSVAYLMLES